MIKRWQCYRKHLRRQKEEGAYLKELKEKRDEQRAIFKAEEDELVRAIEEQLRENAKLREDLEA